MAEASGFDVSLITAEHTAPNDFVTVTWTILGSGGSTSLKETLGDTGFADKLTTSMTKQGGKLATVKALTIDTSKIKDIQIAAGSHFCALIFFWFQMNNIFNKIF